jgi:hypothetical protein
MTTGRSIAEEGEGKGNPVPPAPSGSGETKTEASRFWGRARDSWRVLTGRDIGEQLTSDPEARIRHQRLSNENGWRNVYAFVLLCAMLWQIWTANKFFQQYSEVNDYILDSSVIIAFLSSVVVEVIGLVLVITQSLFPKAPDT